MGDFSASLRLDWSFGGAGPPVGAEVEVGCPRRSSEHLLSGPGREGLCRQWCRAWGRHPEECHPGGSAELSVPHAEGGAVLLPGAHPRSVLPQHCLHWTHSGPVTSGVVTQLQKKGSEVEGCSAHHAQPLTGTR